tara:strand:+ start:3022 stop:5037 length:2016 start_codon:yes stop_codon:yes gene_type:complete
MNKTLLTEIQRIKEVMGMAALPLITENALIIKLIAKAGVKGMSKAGAKQLKKINNIINGAVSNASLIKELKTKGLISNAEELLPDNLAAMPTKKQAAVVGKLLMTQANFVDAFAGKLTSQVSGEVNKFIDPKILASNVDVLMNNLGVTFDASDLVKIGDEIFKGEPNLIQLAIRKGNKKFPKYFFTQGGFKLNAFQDFGRKAMQDMFDSRVFGKTDLKDFLSRLSDSPVSGLDKATVKRITDAFSSGKPITDVATQQKLINAILGDSDLMNEFFEIIRKNADLQKLVKKKGFTAKNIKSILGSGVELTDEYVEMLTKYLKEDSTWMKIWKTFWKVIFWTPTRLKWPLSIFLLGYGSLTWTINQISESIVAHWGGAGDKGKPNDALSPAMYQSVMKYPYLAAELSGFVPSEAKAIAKELEDALDGWTLMLISGTFDKPFKVSYDKIPTILAWSMVTHFYEKDYGSSLKDDIGGMSVDLIPYPLRKMGKDKPWYDITKENVYKDIKLKPYATTLSTSADDKDMVAEIAAKWPKYPKVLYMDDEEETTWYRLRSGDIPAKVLGGLLQSDCPDTLKEMSKKEKVEGSKKERIVKYYKDIKNCVESYNPQNFNASYIDTTGNELGAYSDTEPTTVVKEKVLDLTDIVQEEDDGMLQDLYQKVEDIIQGEQGTVEEL